MKKLMVLLAALAALTGCQSQPVVVQVPDPAQAKIVEEQQAQLAEQRRIIEEQQRRLQKPQDPAETAAERRGKHELNNMRPTYSLGITDGGLRQYVAVSCTMAFYHASEYANESGRPELGDKLGKAMHGAMLVLRINEAMMLKERLGVMPSKEQVDAKVSARIDENMAVINKSKDNRETAVGFCMDNIDVFVPISVEWTRKYDSDAQAQRDMQRF
jgi:hypothetical protein